MNETNRYQEPTGADLDPVIRRFVQLMSEAFARHPEFSTMSHREMRQIAEQVRAPWNVGGPVMASRTDLNAPTTAGSVRLRIHNPSYRPRKPALIYLHGGGWTLFSIDTHDRLMREYAARSEAVVIGVDYSLSPEAKFPTALHQIVDIVRWARRNARDLDIDANRIALGGDSAGGNLSMTACLKLRDEGEPDAVRAMVLNYGAFDSHCSETALRRYGGAGYMLGSDEMTAFWRNYVRGDTDASDPLVCPIHADLRQLPPAFLAIAECDILAEQNIAMAARLRAAGVPVETIVYEGASHSFLEAISIAGVSDRALGDTCRWLRAVLRPRPD